MTRATKIIKTIHFCYNMLGIWTASFDGANLDLPVTGLFKLKIELPAMPVSGVIL